MGILSRNVQHGVKEIRKFPDGRTVPVSKSTVYKKGTEIKKDHPAFEDLKKFFEGNESDKVTIETPEVDMDTNLEHAKPMSNKKKTK